MLLLIIVSRISRLQIAMGGWAWSGSPIEEDMSIYWVNTGDIVGERKKERGKKQKWGKNSHKKVHADRESCVKVVCTHFCLFMMCYLGSSMKTFFFSLHYNKNKHGWSTFIPWFHFTLNCHSRMQTTNRYIVSSPSCHPQTKRLRASPPMFNMCDLALEILDEVHESNP